MTADKVMDTLLYVLIAVAVLPTIATSIAGGANLTGASLVIFSLIPVFVVWGMIKYIRGRSSR